MNSISPPALYIQRSTRSDFITPSSVKTSPEDTLLALINGHFWMHESKSINFLQPRNFYSSGDNLFSAGRFGYNILIALQGNLRANMHDVIVYTENHKIVDFSTGEIAKN